MSEKAVLGVDVGGTNVKMGLVTCQGSVLVQQTFETNAGDGPAALVNALSQRARSMVDAIGLQWADVRAVGIGLPAFLDLDRGHVIEAVNLHWTDVPIAHMVTRVLQKDVAVDNDGNLAALGEVWAGAGRGAKYAVAATIGTGIGGGMVFHGQVYRGASAMAAEIGHMPMLPDGPLCNCGQRGCFETLASATAIVRAGVAAGLVSPLGESSALTARDVFHYAIEGHELACEVVSFAVHWMARGFALIANMFNPDVIVVGGGVTAAGDLLFVPLERAFRKLALPRTSEACRLLPAALGNDAGFIGAARLAWQQAT